MALSTCRFLSGPWLLKAGWGPLARLEYAVDAGIAGGAGDKKAAPNVLVGLVRRSRAAFAAAHHPAYANFLRKRLQDEETEAEAMYGDDADAPLSAFSHEESAAIKSVSDNSGGRGGGRDTTVVVDSDSGSVVGDGEEQRLMEEAFKNVGQLEDRLGRVRKSRLGGVKDRPPKLGLLRRAPIGAIDLERIEKEVDSRRPR